MKSIVFLRDRSPIRRARKQRLTETTKQPSPDRHAASHDRPFADRDFPSRLPAHRTCVRRATRVMHSAMQFPSTRVLPAILALAIGSGCSFTFIDTVPDDAQRRPYFDCTSTYGLPVADGVFALSGVVSAVATLSQSKDEFEDENDGANRDVFAGVSIAQAAVFVASGIYGVIKTEQCADA